GGDRCVEGRAGHRDDPRPGPRRLRIALYRLPRPLRRDTRRLPLLPCTLPDGEPLASDPGLRPPTRHLGAPAAALGDPGCSWRDRRVAGAGPAPRGAGLDPSSLIPKPELEEHAMKLPVQIAFHNLPHDAGIESSIRANAEWLDNYHDRIMSCRVVVDRTHLHHKEGNLCQVRIDLKVPGGELAVKREPSQQPDSPDLDFMIRDAFDEARRQLEDFARRRRGEVTAPAPCPHPRAGVVRVFPEPGYGFLETPDGRELYFHRNSVVKAHFEDLKVGTEVRFAEELGDKGPQASTVAPVGRHSRL